MITYFRRTEKSGLLIEKDFGEFVDKEVEISEYIGNILHCEICGTFSGKNYTILIEQNRSIYVRDHDSQEEYHRTHSHAAIFCEKHLNQYFPREGSNLRGGKTFATLTEAYSEHWVEVNS